MRFAIAISVLVLSGVLILLGIGQRTLFAPPADITMGSSESITTHYAVLPATAVEALKGTPSVRVSGAGVTAMVGDQHDVNAWVAKFDHTVLSVDAKRQAIVLESVQAETPAEPVAGSPSTAPAAPTPATASPTEKTPANTEPTLLDPRGSDLWVQEAGAEDARQVDMPVNLSSTQAVLIAATGETELADGVSIVWMQDRRTPFAGPLLVTGGVLAVVGAVLYLLALDHDRRGLGPRRGRTGPLLGIRDSFTRRKEARARQRAASASAGAQKGRGSAARVALPSLALVALLGLSGCSADYWPSFGGANPAPTTQTTDPNVAHVPVTRAQIDRIVADVATVSNAADDARDAEALRTRFAGDALQQRAANYKIRAAVSDYDLIPPRISDEQLGYELVQSTDQWPRTMFITVAAAPEPTAAATPSPSASPSETAAPTAAETPSLALLLTQANPHENYKVERVLTLRGGITMPEAAPAEEGTALLSNDLQTLVLAPGQVGAAYATALAGDKTSESSKLFDFTDDKLIENSGAAWVALAQQNAAANGQEVAYSVTVQQSTEPVVSLSTGAGGALVATTLVENRVADSGGGKWKPTADGSVTALSGLSGRQERIVRQVTHQLLFFVPNKGSNQPIQLLGTATQMVGASN